MSQTFVTQCPHCQTRFRVSREQLAIANGSVRCGACMQVFDAAGLLADQLKDAPAEPQVSLQPLQPLHLKDHHAPLKLEATSLPPVRQNEPFWIHDDMDTDGFDAELARLEREEQQAHARHPETPRSSRSVVAPDHDEIEEVHPDEAWAIELLREEKSVGEAPTSLRIPDEDLPRPRLHTHASEDAERLEPTLGGLPADTDDDEPERDEPELEPQAKGLIAESDDEPRPVRSKRQLDALEDLNDEPLQLDWRRPRKPWGRRLAWAGVNLLALLALGGQYVWYHFDELARQDRYRSWFAQICPEVGCRLPSKVDIDQIRSSNLVVRSHPEFSGALVVDAILYNRATFSQPFPLLELRFADLNGQPIANRIFKPAEYLSGEMAGGREMPPQTPIHISLDILDPGPKAVNYSLRFISPE